MICILRAFNLRCKRGKSRYCTQNHIIYHRRRIIVEEAIGEINSEFIHKSLLRILDHTSTA